MTDYEFKDIEAFNTTNAALAELKNRYCVVADCTTKEGYDENKRGLIYLSKLWNSVDKDRKAKTEEAREYVKGVNGEGNRIINELKELGKPMKEARIAEDERAEREKEARIAKLQLKVDGIYEYKNKSKGLDSEAIATLIEEVEAIDENEGFYDLRKEAMHARIETLEHLRSALVEKMTKERMKLEMEEANRKLKEEKAARKDERLEREQIEWENNQRTNAEKIRAEEAGRENQKLRDQLAAMERENDERDQKLRDIAQIKQDNEERKVLQARLNIKREDLESIKKENAATEAEEPEIMTPSSYPGYPGLRRHHLDREPDEVMLSSKILDVGYSVKATEVFYNSDGLVKIIYCPNTALFFLLVCDTSYYMSITEATNLRDSLTDCIVEFNSQ